MKLLILASLCGAALAGAVAMSLDSGDPLSIGPVGAGVLLGSMLGLAIGAAGAAWQARLLARGSRFALNAFVLTFLVKLVVVCAGTLVLHALDLAWVDWRAYLVSFPFGALWITAFVVLSNVRALRHRSA